MGLISVLVINRTQGDLWAEGQRFRRMSSRGELDQLVAAGRLFTARPARTAAGLVGAEVAGCVSCMPLRSSVGGIEREVRAGLRESGGEGRGREGEMER